MKRCRLLMMARSIRSLQKFRERSMIYHIIPAVVVATLIVIGHVIKRKRIASYNKRAEFTVDFNNMFFDFADEVLQPGA